MRLIDADAFDKALSDAQDKCRRNGGNFRFGVLSTVRENLANAPTVDAVPVVRCRDCRHKKLDGPSTCKGIVNEFYCDAKLEWRYQYEGEPDILDWYCADGEVK